MSWRKEYKAAMRVRSDKLSERRNLAGRQKIDIAFELHIKDLKWQLDQWKRHAKLLEKNNSEGLRKGVEFISSIGRQFTTQQLLDQQRLAAQQALHCHNTTSLFGLLSGMGGALR